MNDMLLFFRNRNEDLGIVRRVKIELPNGIVRLLVFYSKQEIIGWPALLQDKVFGSDSEYETHKQGLLACVAQHGGGLFIEQQPRYDGSFLSVIQTVSALSPQTYSPPQSVFVLDEFADRLDEKPFDHGRVVLPLKPEAHVILPVDETAQFHLLSFRDNFACWFPRDFEVSLYQLLRQPSFSERLERLEKLALAEHPKPLPAAQPRFYAAPPPTAQAEEGGDGLIPTQALAILAGIIVAILLSLSLPAMFKPQPPEPPAAQAKPPAISPELQTAFNSLLNTLSSKKASDSHLQNLWDSYFAPALNIKNQNPGKLALTAEQISEALKNQDFIWGLIKLQALANYKVVDADYQFLETQGGALATIHVFEAIHSPKNSYVPSRADECLLAFLVNQINAEDIKSEFRKHVAALSNAQACQLNVAELGADASIIEHLQSRIGETATDGHTAANGGDTAPTPALAQSVGDLVETLSGKTRTNPNLKALWAGHFAKAHLSYGKPIKADGVDTKYTDDDAKTLFYDEYFIWGLIKLQAFTVAAQNGISLNPDYLASIDAKAKTYEAFKTLYGKEPALLAGTGCWLDFLVSRVDSTGDIKTDFLTKVPGLFKKADCLPFTLDTLAQAVPVIDGLTAKLKELSEPPPKSAPKLKPR